MKDEEMAEQYKADYGIDLCCLCRECEVENINPCQHKKDAMYGYKDGFLAGLKAGRPQWHEPEELPPKEKNTPNTSIYVLDQYGQKVFYSFFYKVWKNKSDFETKVTHWCEIPTFDKESK